ncbi:MAG: hypothetical protein EOO05_13615, partial [Chitinophagaceae bacterium]
MRKPLLIALLFPVLYSTAQTVTVSGNIVPGTYQEVQVYRPSMGFMFGSLEGTYVEGSFTASGKFEVPVSITGPEMAYLQINDTSGDKSIMLPLILVPGYQPRFVFDKDGHFTVSGKGAADNRELTMPDYDSIQSFYGDTLPMRSYNYINRITDERKRIFSQFVSAHKDVSTDFIRLWTAELDYSKASTFFGYRTNN